MSPDPLDEDTMHNLDMRRMKPYRETPVRDEWRSLCDDCGNSLIVWFLIVVLAVVWLGSVARP